MMPLAMRPTSMLDASRHFSRRVVANCGLAAVLAWSGAGQGEPGCSVDPEQPKLYRLELTVPATFCRGRADDLSCRTFPKPSLLQLHGLWPNYRSGFPVGGCSPGECVRQNPGLGAYCQYPAPPGLYESSAWQGLKDYMAGAESCLERHEWVKHGTCTPMDAPAYFRWALNTTRRIAARLDLPSDRRMSRAAFNRRVKRKLPDLDGAIRLTCKSGALSSLYVLYEWGDVPARPIPTRDRANHFGNCPRSFLIPALPPG